MASYDDALLAKAAEAIAKAEQLSLSATYDDAGRAVLDAVTPLIAAQAVEEVAREWQFGGWAILTAPPPAGAIPSLALGQRVTDWLRARVDRVGGGE